MLVVCRIAFALDVSQYAHTPWKVRDGFVKGVISSIAQTPDGYVRIRRAGNQLHIRLMIDDRANTCPERRVVVDAENPDRRLRRNVATRRRGGFIKRRNHFSSPRS